MAKHKRCIDSVLSATLPSGDIPERWRRAPLPAWAVRVLPVDGLPRVPGDLEDHSGNREADKRIGDRSAERDDGRAGDNAKGDERVDARVVPISDQGGAVKALSPAQPDSRGDLVPDESDDTRSSEHPQVTQVLRVDKSLNGFVQGYERADQDRGDDSEPGPTLAARRAEVERNAERNRREAVAVVVDQVGEECHASRSDEDERLDRGGSCQDGKAYRDRLDPVTGFDDRSIYEAMRVTMFVFVIVLVVVIAKRSLVSVWPLDIARRCVTHQARE